MRLAPLLMLCFVLLHVVPLAPPCCEDPLSRECCAAGGECPQLPSGECALASAPVRHAVSSSHAEIIAPPAAVPVAMPAWDALAAPPCPAPVAAAEPRHLSTHPLRN